MEIIDYKWGWSISKDAMFLLERKKTIGECKFLYFNSKKTKEDNKQTLKSKW